MQEVLKNNDYEVWTPDGWSDFEGIVITYDKDVISLEDHDLTCTPNHLLDMGQGFIRADSLPHSKMNEKVRVYDLLNVEKKNQYYTNGLLSHNCLYIDEAAFLRDDMEFYESTYPTISSGKDSRIIITSTPNGARGLFHKLWSEAVEGLNTFKYHKVTWDMVPGRDEEWKREQIANTSSAQFEQEHNGNFRGSQNSLLEPEVLESLPVKKPISVYGDLHVFEEAKPKHQYLITVDSSRGLGGDYSAFIVHDITKVPYKVVARYKNNRISPLMYPQVIKSVAEKYNTAYILTEVNDIGEQVASILYYDFEYENCLMCYTEKNKQTIGFVKDARVGVRTTVAVKSIGCSNVKTMIEQGRLLLNDEELINEFGTFVAKGRSYEADKGAHDDLVMCSVLFAWAMSQQFMIDVTNGDIGQHLRESNLMDQIMSDLVPFGIIDDGNMMFDGLGTEDSAEAFNYMSHDDAIGALV